MTTAESTSGALMESIEANHAEPTLAELLQEQAEYLKTLENVDRRYSLAAQDQSDDQFLINWYMRTRKQIMAELDDVKQARDRQINGLKGRLSALAWCRGKEFEAAVERMKGKNKGYTSDHGWAGWKKSKESVKPLDEEAGWYACVSAGLIDALPKRIARTTPVLEHLKKTGELLDGFKHHMSEDKFQPSTWIDNESYQALTERQGDG